MDLPIAMARGATLQIYTALRSIAAIMVFGDLENR